MLSLVGIKSNREWKCNKNKRIREIYKNLIQDTENNLVRKQINVRKPGDVSSRNEQVHRAARSVQESIKYSWRQKTNLKNLWVKYQGASETISRKRREWTKIE